jgi:hypothetical protein
LLLLPPELAAPFELFAVGLLLVLLALFAVPVWLVLFALFALLELLPGPVLFVPVLVVPLLVVVLVVVVVVLVPVFELLPLVAVSPQAVRMAATASAAKRARVFRIGILLLSSLSGYCRELLECLPQQVWKFQSHSKFEPHRESFGHAIKPASRSVRLRHLNSSQIIRLAYLHPHKASESGTKFKLGPPLAGFDRA